MTPTEIFCEAVISLAKQGKQSLAHSGACMYRSPEGRKCAVGVFIPDEMYRPEMENDGDLEGILAGVDEGRYQVPDFFLDNVGLLSDLQDFHDGSVVWRDPHEAMQKLVAISEGRRVAGSTAQAKAVVQAIKAFVDMAARNAAA